MGKTDFVTLEAAMARDWLGQQVRLRMMQEANYRFSEEVQAFMPDTFGIHMIQGVAYLACLLGLEVQETARPGSEYPWEYSFVYSGARFYQIS